MELPFIVVFEPPSQDELRTVLRMRRTWAAGVALALAIGTAVLLAAVPRAEAGPRDAAVPLVVSSHPAGAAVWLDGHPQGATPLNLPVAAGPHQVLLKAADALDAHYVVQVPAVGGALDVRLWRRQPSLTRLRPALPGAQLTDVRLLADGTVGLVIALPPGQQLQAWRLDPDTGALAPVLTDVAGSRLAFAPDGQHLAIVGQDVGAPAPEAGAAAGVGAAHPSVVWLDAVGGSAPPTGWRPPLDPGEQVLDASWSPAAERLLVVTGQRLADGAARSRLAFVDAAGQSAQAALSLPAEVVAGSEEWSPDGRWVAFVAHAGMVNALCLLGVDDTFRYVADLDPSSALPLAYPPASWSADSERLVFVAPHQHPGGVPFGWLQPDTQHALYVADVAQPTPALLGNTDVDLAIWREDGQLLGLGRPGRDGALAVRVVSSAGAGGEQLLGLPLQPGGTYAAAWDLARGRLLVASPDEAGGTDYWLALLGLDGGS